MNNYRQLIEIVPNKRFGKPCLKGTRITVYDVLNWLASGLTKDEITKDYPELSQEMISACLFYAADRSQFHAVA